ncbi:PIN domain-containing protein [Yinghuangia sp. YIM S09857]|uniref:PIN domain-containing protein n=1 Tax=Yinghuangia sp. YIM S09857 TaxID=3436929 RepID=UPI003F531D32
MPIIVFDSNPLNRQHPDRSRNFDVLRALKAAGYTVAVPRMVLTELTAHGVAGWADDRAKAISAIEAVNGHGWQTIAVPEPFKTQAAARHWEQKLTDVLDVLETPEGGAEEALRREAFRLKPARAAKVAGKDTAIGARDVAIWLTVAKLLHDTDETVYFVTNNTKDFGDGTSLAAPMDQDVHGVAHRLHILADFAAVIENFAKPLSKDDDTARSEVLELLSAGSARDLIQAAAYAATDRGIHGHRGSHRLVVGDEGVLYAVAHDLRWLTEPTALLRSVDNMAGHQIDDRVWYTATADWLLVGIETPRYEQPGVLGGLRPVVAQWRTRLLMSTTREEPPTILDDSLQRPLDRATQESDDPSVRQLLEKASLIAQEDGPPVWFPVRRRESRLGEDG